MSDSMVETVVLTERIRLGGNVGTVRLAHHGEGTGIQLVGRSQMHTYNLGRDARFWQSFTLASGGGVLAHPIIRPAAPPYHHNHRHGHAHGHGHDNGHRRVGVAPPAPMSRRLRRPDHRPLHPTPARLKNG